MHEVWDDYRTEQRKRREDRLPARREEISALFPPLMVRDMNEGYQYRVTRGSHRIDLYPVHARFHDLKTNRRGSYPVGRLKEWIWKMFTGKTGN